MKIGLVIYGSLSTVSGGYLYDRMLVNWLRRSGDTVRIISLQRRAYALNLLDNLRRHGELDVDVLLQDELNHPSLFLANRRRHRMPIVSIVHHLKSSERRSGWKNAIYRRIERAYLDCVDGFIYNSATTRRSVELLIRRNNPCVVATPGGDRLGSSTPASIRRRAHQSGPLRLVSLGSVTPGKGVDILLEALALLPRQQFHLDLVGSPAAAPGFAAKMRRKALSLRLPVAFRGPLGDRRVGQLLGSSHVMVLPSYYEGFGIAFAEGMAHGLPALSTKVGAIPELVRDGVNGFLVDPGDAVALADRLRLLGGRRNLLERLALGALSRFESLPTWNQSTGQMRDFLLSLTPRQTL